MRKMGRTKSNASSPPMRFKRVLRRFFRSGGHGQPTAPIQALSAPFRGFSLRFPQGFFQRFPQRLTIASKAIKIDSRQGSCKGSPFEFATKFVVVVGIDCEWVLTRGLRDARLRFLQRLTMVPAKAHHTLERLPSGAAISCCLGLFLPSRPIAAPCSAGRLAPHRLACRYPGGSRKSSPSPEMRGTPTLVSRPSLPRVVIRETPLPGRPSSYSACAAQPRFLQKLTLPAAIKTPVRCDCRQGCGEKGVAGRGRP